MTKKAASEISRCIVLSSVILGFFIWISACVIKTDNMYPSDKEACLKLLLTLTKGK